MEQGETNVSANESWILQVKRAVEYTGIDGTTRSISPGKHRITAVRAKGVPTGEAELECWIIEENRGAEDETAHDVDAETVEAWQESRAVEIGEPAPTEPAGSRSE